MDWGEQTFPIPSERMGFIFLFWRILPTEFPTEMIADTIIFRNIATKNHSSFIFPSRRTFAS